MLTPVASVVLQLSSTESPGEMVVGFAKMCAVGAVTSGAVEYELGVEVFLPPPQPATANKTSIMNAGIKKRKCDFNVVLLLLFF
jgi:hypothetical protein